MLPIHKNIKDPLGQHRNQPNATYDNIPSDERKKLVDSLLYEQGHICAYCMCRVKAFNPNNPKEKHNLKVEHWQCQEKFPALQLVYGNMLAVCTGGEGDLPKKQHCDTKKANRDLKYNPSNTTHYATLYSIYYNRVTGEVHSTDIELHNDLTNILNLNTDMLRRSRLEVFNGVTKALEHLKPHATKANIQYFLEQWQKVDSSHRLNPFAGVAIWYLKKRLRRA